MVMFIGKDTSRRLHPIWAFIAGFVLLAADCAILYLLLAGLKSGEIWRITRRDAYLVSRAGNPERFWGLRLFPIRNCAYR